MTNKILVFLFIMSVNESCYSQAFPSLSTDKIKLDVRHNCFTDSSLSEYIDEMPIEVWYSGQYALAHVAYRTEEGEAFMKQSTALIYRLEDNHWKCLRSVPYNYSITQSNKDSCLFISNNFICNTTGSCEIYIEVQKLEKGELIVLKKLEGFSNYAYWDGLLSMKQEDQIKKAIGDTIEIDFKVLNHEVTSSNGLLLQFEKQVKVLEGFDEYDIKTKNTETLTTLEIDD